MITEADLTIHRPMVETASFRLTKDKEEAKDLTQKVMIKAWVYRDKFLGGNIKAWFNVLTRNEYINDYRKKVKVPVMMDVWDLDYAITIGERDLGIGDELRGAIESADDWERQVLILMCEGYMYEEMAEIIKIPTGTVRSRIHKMRKKMKERIRKNKLKNQ